MGVTKTYIKNKEHEVLLAVAAYHLKYGIPPTLRELAETSGLAAHSAVKRHILALDLAGLVTCKPFTARSIVITKAGRQALAERGK